MTGAVDLPPGGSYRPLDGRRILDTFHGVGGPAGRLHDVTVNAAGRGGVPTTGVLALAVNLKVGSPAGTGHLTAYAADQVLPPTRNVSYEAGTTAAGLAVVTVDATVRFKIHSDQLAYLYADVEGYFTTASTAGITGLYHRVTPRVLLAPSATAMAAGAKKVLSPSVAAVPSDAEAVVLNLTVRKPAATGSLTVYPTGTTRVPPSTINVVAGVSRSNRVIVPMLASRTVTLLNNAGTAHPEVDVTGYFTRTGPGSYYVPLGTLAGRTPSLAFSQRFTDSYYLDTGIGVLESAFIAGVSASSAVPAMNAVVHPVAAMATQTITPQRRSGTARNLTVSGWRPPTTDLAWSTNTPASNAAMIDFDTGGGADVEALGYDYRAPPPIITDVVGYFANAPSTITATGAWNGTGVGFGAQVARPIAAGPGISSVSINGSGNVTTLAGSTAYVGFDLGHQAPVLGVPNTIVALAGINDFPHSDMFGLSSDGSVWTWPGISAATSPQANKIDGLTDITSIIGGRYVLHALRSDGSVWTLGNNVDNQFGTGTTSGWTSTPTQVPGLPPVASVQGGSGGVSEAIDLAGHWWFWGKSNILIPPHDAGSTCVGGRILGGPSFAPILCPDGTVQVWDGSSYQPVAGAPAAVDAIVAGSRSPIILGQDARIWIFDNDVRIWKDVYGLHNVRLITPSVANYVAIT
jgi:hypothetical protein